MRLSLLLIYENLSSNGISLKMEESPGPYLERASILPKAHSIRLDPDTFYVDINGCSDSYDAAELSSITLVAYRTPHTSVIRNGLSIGHKRSIRSIFHSIMEIFDSFQRWDDTVKMRLIEGKGLQEIFDLSSMVTRDTVYLTDISMKMHVYSTPTVMADISAIWRYQVDHGYMPIHIMDRLITTGELEKIRSFRRAFTLETDTFNLPYTCRNIFSENTLKAHIFIVSIYSEPTQTHREIADELGDLLTFRICSDPVFSSRAGLLHENFFQDILDRRATDLMLIQQQIAIFGWDIHDTYSILVIDMEGQNKRKTHFLIDYLSSTNEHKAIQSGEHMICIFHVTSRQDKEIFSQKIIRTLNRMDLKGALSKNFDNICDMYFYYRQASNILRFYRKEETDRSLFLQEEFGLYSIFGASLEKYDAFELCHPDIITLYEYDKKNGTDHLETLYQYLINERNAVKAAKALFIHRNTMNYRLDKIKGSLVFDEDDPVNRFYVLLSIFLLKFQDGYLGWIDSDR